MDRLSAFMQGGTVAWIIPVFFFIHELEEWNILSWYKKHFVELPASTETSVRVHIFVLGFASFLLTFIASVSPDLAAGGIVVFMSGFMLTNAVQHVIQTFQYETYAPGLATGILCTAACVWVNVVWVRNGTVFPPLYAMTAAGIPAVVKTIRMKHRMTPEVRNVHEFFIRLSSGLHLEK